MDDMWRRALNKYTKSLSVLPELICLIIPESIRYGECSIATTMYVFEALELLEAGLYIMSMLVALSSCRNEVPEGRGRYLP